MTESAIESPATATAAPPLTIFGIRHHGPGSARSLLQALEERRPDLLLIEGPADATEALELCRQEGMEPPVALLLHDAAEPRRCAFYPFASFSPEWQAIRWAQGRGVPVRFMDLPQTHWLAMQKEEEEALEAELKRRAEEEGEVVPPVEAAEEADSDRPEDAPEDPGAPPEELLRVRRDPLSWLAEAAGYEDSERWWEHLVEQRADSAGAFEAIAEAMGVLRSELSLDEVTAPSQRRREQLREAWMRKEIRAAMKDAPSVAVVCGAWHVPALDVTAKTAPKAKDDNDLLKGLPKTRVRVTWAPWTFGRLSMDSGYSAGVSSPGWYDFLFEQYSSGSTDALSAGWLARTARLLRDEDLDISSAHVIEAVRLAETLATLRGRAMPGLEEMNEAITTVMLFGDATALALVRKRLIVSERLGRVPEGTPETPLQQDLGAEQKRLRLKPSADSTDKLLDLRNETDLARSHLLHRLALLGVPWGKPMEGGGKGTFREAWRLQWAPELAVTLIEASAWGNTVLSAAEAITRKTAKEAQRLPDLTNLMDRALLADLGEAIPDLVRELEDRAAIASDIPQMMEAIPALANIARYGNVRGTRAESVAHVLDSLLARVCIGLAAACSSLDEDASARMVGRIEGVEGAVLRLENSDRAEEWRQALAKLLERDDLHGLLMGRVCRLLLDNGLLEAEEAARRLGLALSLANDPLQAGAWVEGFLSGSALLLISTDTIWEVLDRWVTGLTPEAFQALLPLLRRTFGRFEAPERRQMGERLRSGTVTAKSASRAMGAAVNEERAAAVLPMLRKILA